MILLQACRGQRRSRRAQGRSGFTLVEVMISAGIFLMVGYALSDAIRMANHSHSAVTHVASSNRALRDTTARIQRELKSAQNASLVVAAGVDGNQQVTFRHPVESGGPAWGIHDTRLGPTEAEQNRAGWSLRYTVRDVNLGAGRIDRRLLRQVLDDAEGLRLEDVLLGGLSNDPNPPGFTMVQNGGVWEVTLRTAGEGNNHGRVSRFHVRTRN